MDFTQYKSNSANDFDYRRKRAFQSISNGTLTNLMLLLDGVDDNIRRKLLTSRSDRHIALRRPSTAGNFQIQNPTLLASACAEWYMEIVEFLASQEFGMDETVSVCDESNDIVNYTGVSPLCIAAITGKFKMVQILVENGADINHQNSIGNTALYEACSEGHISVVNYLIQKGANIELANDKKVTCLMIASYSNNAEIVKVLTNYGVNANRKDRNDRNALFYCIETGSVPIFKLLRQSGAMLSCDHQGTTVLMEAAYYSQYEMVKWLMKNRDDLNLNPNAFDKKGRNVLFYCTEAGNLEIFQFLLSHGVAIHPALDGSTVVMTAALRGRHRLLEYFHENAAQLGVNINSRDKRGRNCLFYCVSGGDVPLLDKLVGFGASVECASNGMNLLQQAAVKGNVNFSRYLLDHAEKLDLDIQGRDQDGWNALFFAIASGNQQLFRLLYESGVNTDSANDGRTLLMQAALRGNLEMIHHILGNQTKYNSDINDVDTTGRSALYLCLQSDAYQDAFKLLLDRGAQINKTNHGSNIFMETAKVTKNTEVLKMLVKMAERLNFAANDQDDQGRNVLFYAAQNGSYDVMNYLLSLGVSLVNDADNRTVLMIAVENGHQRLVELLIERHRELFLNLDEKDTEGRNALFYCVESGQLECFRALIEAGIACTSDNTGVNVLMLLAQTSHKEFLNFITTTKKTLDLDLQAKDEKGDAAIHYALRCKQYDNLLSLVNNGADLVTGSDGVGVVSRCVDERDFWVVEALATSGVDLTEDLNRKDSDGVPYFHHLLNSGIDDALMIALIEMYYDEEKDTDADGVTMAMKLVAMENLIVKHLIEGVRIDLNRSDLEGRNLLQHCAFANNLDNLKYLLAYGAKFDTDKCERTALMACARGCYDDVKCLNHLLKYIFRSEYSRKVVDSKGRTALHYGVRSGNAECVKLLLDNGLDINTPDNEGMTPFLMAAKSTHAKVAEILGCKGADTKQKNNQSQSALHLVFESPGSLAITKALIDQGCDVNARDQSERTPLMLAVRYDNLRPIKCLLENGADASLVDADGHDALHYCPEDYHIIRVLIGKHKDKNQPAKSQLVSDSKLLTDHLLRQIGSGNEEVTDDDGRHFEMTQNLERIVSGAVKREPKAFDHLCNTLKNAQSNPQPMHDGCREFYV